MGSSWRQSASTGPEQLNFSQSGGGVSAGGRGARISTGPHGTYVYLGAGGFRYSHRVGESLPSPRLSPPPIPTGLPLGKPGIGQKVENVEPAQLIESTADDLLAEIRRKHGRVSLFSLSVITAVLGMARFLVALGTESPGVLQGVSLAVGLAGLVAIPWAAWWDRKCGSVRIEYVLDPLGEKVQEGLERLLAALERAHTIWSVQTEHIHGDWKRNAGAGRSVGRQPVRVGWGAPPIVKTNVRVGFLEVERTRLYFFPDRLLIFGYGGVRAVPYPDIHIKSDHVRFVEDGSVPRDAQILGTTWRFVNKDGGPDRRFANNFQMPVVLYGVLDLSSPSGLRMSLQTSAHPVAFGAAELLRIIQAAIQDLQSRDALVCRPPALPSFEDDPPPLVLPARRIIRSAISVLSLRWLLGLPEWAVPIGWGVIFSLPLVALAVRLAGQRSVGADLFLGGSFVFAGFGAANLTVQHIRTRRKRNQEEAVARKSRFRALLMSELKSRPSNQFNFAALVGDGGLPRTEADHVADEVFRRVADRVVADGVVTPAERAKLNLLAQVLEMDATRASRLEDAAKSERYRMAVADVMADGIVTEEESRMLEELRDNLGIEEPPRTPDDITV